MPYAGNRRRTLGALGAVLYLILASTSAEARAFRRQNTVREQKSAASKAGQVGIPNRPKEPLFQGQQGKQKAEIHYDPPTGMVMLKLLVQDPNGYFVPNIRRGNFVVYENGARQQNVEVEVEHAPVSLAVLNMAAPIQR